MNNKGFKDFFQDFCLNDKNELNEIGTFIVAIMGISLFKILLDEYSKKGVNEKC